MATVNKNFRVKNGLVIEGTTATVNGFDLLSKSTTDQTYIINLVGGSATSANTPSTTVKRDESGNFAAGTITATFSGNLTGNVTGNVSGSAGTVTSLSGQTSDNLTEGSTNKYFTDERAQDAIGNSLGSGLSYNDTSGAISVDTTVIANKTYVDTSISNLVDSAPATLDTLNELAAALADDPNFATTITTSVGTKVSKTGDTMTGLLVLSADPSANLGAATKQYVDTAKTAAETTASTALSNVLNGSTDFTAIDVNAVSRQVAATTGNIATAAATTLLSWNKTNYRSAKILVKAKNGVHTHVSEVIATLDTSDNIALNEYAITTTNGLLITIDADIDAGNVRLRVTPANNNTEVVAHATLLV